MSGPPRETCRAARRRRSRRAPAVFHGAIVRRATVGVKACERRAWIMSLDDVIRANEEALRQIHPERLGGLEIHDELERGGPLNRELTRWRAREDPRNEVCAALVHSRKVGPVGHEPTR